MLIAGLDLSIKTIMSMIGNARLHKDKTGPGLTHRKTNKQKMTREKINHDTEGS